MFEVLARAFNELFIGVPLAFFTLVLCCFEETLSLSRREFIFKRTRAEYREEKPPRSREAREKVVGGKSRMPSRFLPIRALRNSEVYGFCARTHFPCVINKLPRVKYT